jgi:hypothetical protein
MSQSSRINLPYEVPSTDIIVLADRLPVICGSIPEDGETQDFHVPNTPAF